MYTGRIHSIKIHELIICKFFHTVDLTHLKSSFPKIFLKTFYPIQNQRSIFYTYTPFTIVL